MKIIKITIFLPHTMCMQPNSIQYIFLNILFIGQVLHKECITSRRLTNKLTEWMYFSRNIENIKSVTQRLFAKKKNITYFFNLENYRKTLTLPNRYLVLSKVEDRTHTKVVWRSALMITWHYIRRKAWLELPSSFVSLKLDRWPLDCLYTDTMYVVASFRIIRMVNSNE